MRERAKGKGKDAKRCKRFFQKRAVKFIHVDLQNNTLFLREKITPAGKLRHIPTFQLSSIPTFQPHQPQHQHTLTMQTNMLPVICAATTAVTATIAPAATPAPAQQPPNIVIIIADDLGFGDVGCYGANPARIPTPNIDRLAATGLRFTRAYATSATCTPSRYSLLTGEYPWRQKAKKAAILDGDAPLIIDTARPTLATFLKNAGYATALVGKWHLGIGDGTRAMDFNGADIAPGPLEIGFDSAFFIPATVDRVPCVFIDGHRVANLDPRDPIAVSYSKRIPGADPLGYEHPELLKYPADRQHGETIVNGISRIGYMSGGQTARWVDEDIADTLTKRATDFIDASAKSGKPFFLYYGTHDPHVPHMPAPRFRGKSDAGIRGDAIVQLDWIIGRVADSLEKAGVAQNTLLLITSDNGPILFDGYFDGSVEANGDHQPAGGLRGWKYLRFEGGVRVPLIAIWPGRIAPGAKSDAMISLMDLYPSIAAILGRDYPADAGRDGMDASATLLGKTQTSPRASLVVDGIGNVVALRDGDWKYVPANTDTSAGIGSGADPRDKRFADAIVPEDLLFNLADDPAETTNLAARHPEKLQAMRAKLAEIRKASK